MVAGKIKRVEEMALILCIEYQSQVRRGERNMAANLNILFGVS
jgi:hypothetical protein